MRYNFGFSSLAEGSLRPTTYMIPPQLRALVNLYNRTRHVPDTRETKVNQEGKWKLVHLQIRKMGPPQMPNRLQSDHPFQSICDIHQSFIHPFPGIFLQSLAFPYSPETFSNLNMKASAWQRSICSMSFKLRSRGLPHLECSKDRPLLLLYSSFKYLHKIVRHITRDA